MAVRIDGDKAYNVPAVHHDPAGTLCGRYLVRAQAAISDIRHTPGDKAGYAMDCVCDLARTLADTAEVLARQLANYGDIPYTGIFIERGDRL